MEKRYDLQSGKLQFRNRRNYLILALLLSALVAIIWQAVVISRQRKMIERLVLSADSAAAMNAPLQARITILENEQQAARSREISRQDAQAAVRAEFRSTWREYVTATSSYGHGSFFGGIDDVHVTVRNDSRFIIDEVAVTLNYIRQNGELHKQEVVSVFNLAPNSSRTVAGPESGRGSTLTSAISGVLCRDASLLSGAVSSGNSPTTTP